MHTADLGAHRRISSCAVKSKCKWSSFKAITSPILFFFPGQNKTDEGLPSETKHINHGQRVLWHCEERRGGKAKRSTAGRKVGSLCGVMRKGKAAAEKPGRMLIQAGEQLGKMREVVKSTRRSWKISVRDTAVSQMWQKPHNFSGAVCTVVFP